MDVCNPLVSVVIPTYNRREKIISAILSVLSQDYSNFEIVVVDDASSDGTQDEIESRFAGESRVIYLKNMNLKGPSGARNTGISASKGKYIAFLDSDDLWYPNHLSDCISALSNECADVSWGLWFESDGTVKNDKFHAQLFLDIVINELKPKTRHNYYLFGPELLEYLIIRRYYLLKTSTFVFRADLIERSGMFDELLSGGEDVDFFYRLMDGARVCLVNEFHAEYVLGDDNLFGFKGRNQISNPAVALKHKKHKLDELTHLKKMVKYIKDSDGFMFPELMLRSLYQSMYEKYKFLLKLGACLCEQEVLEFSNSFNLYRNLYLSMPNDNGRYFYLAYRSRCALATRIRAKNLDELLAVSHSSKDIILFVEDHILVSHYDDELSFYDLTSAKQLALHFNSQYDFKLEGTVCSVSLMSEIDRQFLSDMRPAIDAGFVCAADLSNGHEGKMFFMAQSNMCFDNSLRRALSRDHKLRGFAISSAFTVA